jgi:hypothetical protein
MSRSPAFAGAGLNSEGCNGPPSAASCLIAGVDDPGRVLADLADRDDAAILDRAVGAQSGRARARRLLLLRGITRSCIMIPHAVSSIEDTRFVLAQPDACIIMPPWMRQSA